MKSKKQGLQKLTETDKKINSLLAKNKILKNDPGEILNDHERIQFGNILAKKLNESKGDERDLLLMQIEEIIPTDTKNQLWENNHISITSSMTKLIEETGKMPTKNQISAHCQLSRQTVSKHLNGYAEHPLYVEQLQQFRFMADRVLAKVIKMAGQGDMKAARLYFDIIGNTGKQFGINTTINTQNNYIQINQTKLSQDIVQKLTPDQLNQIEAVLQSVSKNFPEGR
ncbi:MAG: hypothetical protein WAU23_09225 [Ferruginibacter sp.]